MSEKQKKKKNREWFRVSGKRCRKRGGERKDALMKEKNPFT